MSRKFIISLRKREGFVIKASCPDISTPSPIPQQEQRVGRGPDFLSDGLVPGARNERNLPGLEMASATLLPIRSLVARLTDLAPISIVWNAVFTLVCVEVLPLRKDLWIYSLISRSFRFFLCAVEEELWVPFNLQLHLCTWVRSACVFHAEHLSWSDSRVEIVAVLPPFT